MNKSIVVIGSGSVAKSILPAFIDAGYSVNGIVSRNLETAKMLAEDVSCMDVSDDYSIISNDTGLIVIAVQDNCIQAVVDSLLSALESPEDMIVVHTSGIIESSILAPLEIKGVKIASIHPLCSFPTDIVLNLKGRYFGVEGEHANEAAELVKDIGCIPQFIDSDKKALYHTACTFASGYVNVLLGVTERLMTDAGMESPHAAISLLAGSALRGWEDTGASALTGSISRGDAESVSKHIAAIQGDSFTLDLYKLLAEESLRTAKLAGRLTHDQAKSLHDLIY